MSNKSNNKNHEPYILSNLVLKFDNNNNNTTDFNNKDKNKQDDLNRLGFDRISNKSNNSFNEKKSMDNSNNEQNDNLVNSLIINTIKNKFEKNLNDLNFLKTVGFMRIRFKDVFEGLLKVIYKMKNYAYVILFKYLPCVLRMTSNQLNGANIYK